jgi:hypothetical protein
LDNIKAIASRNAGIRAIAVKTSSPNTVFPAKAGIQLGFVTQIPPGVRFRM